MRWLRGRGRGANTSFHHDLDSCPVDGFFETCAVVSYMEGEVRGRGRVTCPTHNGGCCVKSLGIGVEREAVV